MITLGAVLLLSTIVLRVNGSQLANQDSMQNNKFGILAISLATSVIEEASEKAFDEASASNFVSSTTSLTNTHDFGPEPGLNPDSTWKFLIAWRLMMILMIITTIQTEILRCLVRSLMLVAR